MNSKVSLVLFCLFIGLLLSSFGQEFPYVLEGERLLQKRQNAGGVPIQKEKGPFSKTILNKLEGSFWEYEAFRFSPSKLRSILDPSIDSLEVVLNLGEGKRWPIVLVPNELRSKELLLKASESLPTTYKGYLNLPNGGEVRMSVTPDKLTGFVTLNGEKIFVENLSNLDLDVPKDILISYKESDALDSAYSCAVRQAEGYEKNIQPQLNSRASCPEAYELEIATIATFERYLAQGATINGVNDHILSLLNLVEVNYAPFNILFKVVEQQVITCEDCEPWDDTDDIQELLSEFTLWAPGGFLENHDIGICFFRGQGFGTVGYAWIGSVCTNARYSVVDQLGSTTGNRVLIAHEIGHNFGSNHDPSGSPYIMAPSVNSATGFSPTSIGKFNSHIASRTCLACVSSNETCVPPTVSASLNQASCENTEGSLTFSFADIEGTNTLEFSIDGGQNYPYTSVDDQDSLIVDNLSPGTYSLNIRIMGTNCTTSLGEVTLLRLPSPAPTFSVVNPSCVDADGKLTLFFGDSPDQSGLEFSLDGGSTYPFASPDNAGSYEIPSLNAGQYDVWVRWEGETCPTRLDSLVLDKVSSFSSCDDQDPLTINDTYDSNCLCQGVPNFAQFQVNILLEGFYDSTSNQMSTQLQQKGILPSLQPFGVAPFYYQGTESVEAFSDSIVDWMLLEVRDPVDVNTIRASQAVLLSQSGMLLDVDGSPFLKFPSLPSGDYFLGIYHLGHLGVISSSTLPGNSQSPFYDFSSSSEQARGSNQLKSLGLFFGLFAGDFDGNGILNNLDYNTWRQNPSAINQYLPSDADGNGLINNLDFNLWKANGSKVGDAAVQK